MNSGCDNDHMRPTLYRGEEVVSRGIKPPSARPQFPRNPELLDGEEWTSHYTLDVQDASAGGRPQRLLCRENHLTIPYLLILASPSRSQP